MAGVLLEELTKIYPDGTEAVSSVNLDIKDGTLMVLVGPSGCGKTSILRMIAGLEPISNGVVKIGETIVNDRSPGDRDIAMVFQNYALYPHMTVRQNMSFSLRLRRANKADTERRVRDAAAILGLEEHLDRKPAHLSGGQRQRVAMGRAIVREPKVFLMDEPLSNLDAKLRVQMRAEILRLQRRLGVTTVYVTHDQVEAMTMGDRVAVMRKGVIEQADTPQALYDRPTNLFVAGFIGSPAMNLAISTLSLSGGTPSVEIGGMTLAIDPEALSPRPALTAYDGRKVIVGIRPEDMEDAAVSTGALENQRLHVVVELRESLGSEALVHFPIDSPAILTGATREIAVDTDPAVLETLEASASTTNFVARMHARTRAREGEAIEVAVDTRALHFFDSETGNGIYE